MNETTKSRGILMSAPRVEALLAGRKTQTRRLISNQPTDHEDFARYAAEWHRVAQYGASVRKPEGKKRGLYFNKHSRLPVSATACRYGIPGDTLYVKETFGLVPATAYGKTTPHQVNPEDPHEVAIYRAGFDRCWSCPTKSAMHMPRWASRLTLCLTDVRVERVQDITEADAIAEGIQRYTFPNGTGFFYVDNPAGKEGTPAIIAAHEAAGGQAE